MVYSMSDLWSSFSAYLGNISDRLGDFFDFVKTSLTLPFELISIVPDIIGVSISVVLFVAVTKLILGR